MPASELTVVFADLTGSTGVFEALGNAKATEAVTRLTQWIAEVCTAHDGRVVKMLGDGVLAVFARSEDAVQAAVALQRGHSLRIQRWPEALRMKLQIGVATGEVIEVSGDCYGDAVNTAARLSDLAGAEQILASDRTMALMPPAAHVRHRSLGAVPIRGKAEPQVLHRIEWHEEVVSEFLTMPGDLGAMKAAAPVAGARIELSQLDLSGAWTSAQTPVTLGRVAEASFAVQDPRVSRIHAQIDWRNGVFTLSDLSSYGTWVRFDGTGTELALRRQECTLHGSGEIALGAPFSDFSVPTVAFRISS